MSTFRTRIVIALALCMVFLGLPGSPANAATENLPITLTGGASGNNTSNWFVNNLTGTEPLGSSGPTQHCNTNHSITGLSVEEAIISGQHTGNESFDNGMSLWVNDRQFSAPSGRVGVTRRQGPLGLLPSTVIAGPVSMTATNGVLATTVQYYAAAGVSTARTLVTFFNPSNAAVTADVSWITNVASDSNTRVTETASGDAVFTPEDRWLVTTDGSNDPNLILEDTHVLYGFEAPPGPGATATVIPPTDVSLVDMFSCPAVVNNSQGVRANWKAFTVPAGLKRSLLFFNSIHTSDVEAVTTARSVWQRDADAPNITNPGFGSDLLSGLTAGDLVDVVNWKFRFTNFIATGSGPGHEPRVTLWFIDPTTGIQSQFFSFLAYDRAFQGGVRVAAGDIDADGSRELVTAPGPGGGPHVKIWDVNAEASTVTPRLGKDFFAYDGSFSGGVNVAVGDVDGDGKGEVMTGQGPGGQSRLRVFDFDPTTLNRSLIVDEPVYDDFTGGLTVGAGQLHPDFGTVIRDEIVTGAMAGGGPRVRVFKVDPSNALLEIKPGVFAYDSRFPGGVDVAIGDVNGDGRGDIVTGAGPGGGPHVKAWNISDSGRMTELSSFFAYDSRFSGGVHVGVANLDGDTAMELVTGPGPGGGPHVMARHINTSGAVTGLAANFFAFRPEMNGGVYVSGLSL